MNLKFDVMINLLNDSAIRVQAYDQINMLTYIFIFKFFFKSFS